MSEGITIKISDCSFDPETCPVIPRIIETDYFLEQMSDISPGAKTIREELARFVVLCAGNACPGQDLESVRETLRKKRSE